MLFKVYQLAEIFKLYFAGVDFFDRDIRAISEKFVVQSARVVRFLESVKELKCFITSAE